LGTDGANYGCANDGHKQVACQSHHPETLPLAATPISRGPDPLHLRFANYWSVELVPTGEPRAALATKRHDYRELMGCRRKLPVHVTKPKSQQREGWATLPESIHRAAITTLNPRLKSGFVGLVRQAGLRFRLPANGRASLSAGGSYPPFFRLIPLQDEHGQFYADAQHRLASDRGPLGLGTAMAEHAKIAGIDMSLWGEHEHRIATQTDTISALRVLESSSKQRLSFFRLRTTEALLARLFLWDILTELAGGTPAHEVLEKLHGQADRLVGGIVQMAPAGFICYPLLARNQPLAAVFLTAYGSQVIVLPDSGAFVRPIEFTTWPVGLARVRFAGPGHGVYATSVRQFPVHHAEALLRFLIRRADGAMHRLTAPELFRTLDGDLDVDARWVLWSSVLFGMDAVTSLAVEWNQASAIWTAFRALSTLQGIWQGDRPKAPPLSSLLDPRHLQKYAVATFLEGPQRDWAGGVVINYQRDLEERYPGTSLDAILHEIADLRNLVHGVYATGNLTRRLRVLRRIEQFAPNLQLINEVATFWWTSVLIDAVKNARPGAAPWESTV